MGYEDGKSAQNSPRHGPQEAPQRVSDGPNCSIRTSFVAESASDPLGMDCQGVRHRFGWFCAGFGPFCFAQWTPEDQLELLWATGAYEEFQTAAGLMVLQSTDGYVPPTLEAIRSLQSRGNESGPAFGPACLCVARCLASTPDRPKGYVSQTAKAARWPCQVPPLCC